MHNDLVICFLVNILVSLKESQDYAIFVVIGWGYREVVLLKEIFEAFHVCYFTLAQLNTFEELSLIVSWFDGEEFVFFCGLMSLDFLIHDAQGYLTTNVTELSKGFCFNWFDHFLN